MILQLSLIEKSINLALFMGLMITLSACKTVIRGLPISMPLAPVASNITPGNFEEDTETIITLSYTDANGDLATTCTLSDLSNVTLTVACSCTLGVCTVGVTGTADFYGTARFEYIVSANGDDSNASTATITIDNVEDATVSGDITPPNFDEDTESIITLSYSDPDSDLATTCTLSNLSNVTESTACFCVLGVCTVGVTGTAEFSGAAGFDFTVTVNGVASNSSSAILTVNTLDDAPVASDITPSNGIATIESVVTLSYTDAESDVATSCDVSDLTSGLSVSTPCACALGVCTVGVSSAAGLYGAVSFDYTVTANGSESNTATASFNLSSIFISTWRTTAPAQTITLPLRATFAYNFTVDWGDGTPDSTVTSDVDADRIHTYAAAGDYVVKITGQVQAWYFNSAGDKLKIISITDLGNVGWTNFDQAFSGCTNLTTVKGGDTSSVITMANMFFNATSVNPDTSGWNTSNVTTMLALFRNTTSANPDTSGWNTSNVTTMFGMFWDATAANPDTSGWNTSNVLSMAHMFRGATTANPDTSGWDTAKVTSMTYMFYAATFNPDTGNWDTSMVTDMSHMFRSSAVANPDTSGWDTSRVIDMKYMFSQATAADPDTSGWNTFKVENMRAMFSGATAATPDTSEWDTSRVTDMYYMFSGATHANPDTSGWNTALVTTMGYMFGGAVSANPDTSGWDTGEVLDMSIMFYNAVSANPDTSGWDTSKVQNMATMFRGAILANPDTSGWNTASVTDMSSMFYGAVSANPDTNGWNFSNVTTMANMFNAVTLPTATYSTLLNRIDATSAQAGVILHGGSSKFNASATAARASLTGQGWTITDNGLE